MEWRVSKENINVVAKELWPFIDAARVVALHGQMGAGKTTLVHALCDVKGVNDAVGSPTFSIINEYGVGDQTKPGRIYHIDLYRLQSDEEIYRAGVEDCIHSGEVCFVEWPEKAPGLFPAGTLHLFLELIDDQTRLLKIANK